LVIQEIKVVEMVGIGDEDIEQLTQLQQVTPVLIGAREPRELTAEYDADIAHGHAGQ